MRYLRFLLWALRGTRPLSDKEFKRWKADDPALASSRVETSPVPESVRPGGTLIIHTYWERRKSRGADICARCGLSRSHEIHRVEKSPAEQAEKPSEAKPKY